MRKNNKHSPSYKFTAVIVRGEKLYVARCLEVDVVSQGRTIEAAKENLKEAVELYIESFGLPQPKGKTAESFVTPLEISLTK